VVLAKRYGIREHDLAPNQARFRPVHRPDPHERRRLRRPRPAQGCRRRDHRVGPGRGRHAAGRARRRSRPHLARGRHSRSSSPRTARCSASSYLKDTVKEGMAVRFEHLRAMGIRTVMVTGDNRLTAAKIAGEAGVDDFLAEATPGAQARADQARAGRRQDGRDDRRRDERRPSAGAGRRRRGHEHRDPGGPRGREHGRPRLEPDEADRDRRGRQAAC